MNTSIRNPFHLLSLGDWDIKKLLIEKIEENAREARLIYKPLIYDANCKKIQPIQNISFENFRWKRTKFRKWLNPPKYMFSISINAKFSAGQLQNEVASLAQEKCAQRVPERQNSISYANYYGRM